MITMAAMLDDPFATAAGDVPAGPQFGGTERQGAYLLDLRHQLRDVHVELAGLRHGPEAAEAAPLPDHMLDDMTAIRTKAAASAEIDRVRQALADRRRELRIEKNDARHRQAPAAVAVELEDGFYVYDGEPVKVVHAVHGSGYQYARALDPTDLTPGGKARFSKKIPGLLAALRPEHRLTLESAVELSGAYGMCVRCGATLTDDTSIEQAMGPVCIGKLGDL